MVQLNLLPDVKKEYIAAQKNKAVVASFSIIVTLGAIGLSVVLFLYVTVGQQLQISLVDNDIKSNETQLKAVPDLSKYLTLQNQLQALPSLEAQKGTYSRLLSFLPVLNPSAPNDVKLSSIDLTVSTQTIVFTGETATFESLNVFVDTLHNAEVSYNLPNSSAKTTTKIFSSCNVQNSSITTDNGKQVVAFTVQAAYNEPVFDATNTNMNVLIPNIQTTQSVTGTPKVFGSEGNQ